MRHQSAFCWLTHPYGLRQAHLLNFYCHTTADIVLFAVHELHLSNEATEGEQGSLVE